VNALVSTAFGAYVVDLDEEVVLGPADETLLPAPLLDLGLPLVVATAEAGSTIVAVVERRPPLVVSNDAGRTWREAGGGLPPGRAVAIDPDSPDTVLYAARNRLYLSTDGGRFWRSLAAELPEIEAVAFRV
jgi:hypothetical protein